MVHLSIRSLLPRFLTAFSQNPAFGPGQLRSFTPIFNQKAHEVRNIWFSQINEAQADVIKVDVPNFMGRVTLDIIGLAGQYILATKSLLLADNGLHRVRLQVRLASFQGRRTRHCFQFVGLRRGCAHGSLDHHTTLADTCPYTH